MVSTLASHLFLTAVATVFVSPRVAGAIRCAVCDSSVQGGIGMNNYQQNTMDQSCFGTGGQVAPLKTCADSHPYCITLTKYNYDGTMRSVSRNCSPVLLPLSCLVGTDKATKEQIKVCYNTCSEDGCNWKLSLKQLLNLL